MLNSVITSTLLHQPKVVFSKDCTYPFLLLQILHAGYNLLCNDHDISNRLHKVTLTLIQKLNMIKNISPPSQLQCIHEALHTYFDAMYYTWLFFVNLHQVLNDDTIYTEYARTKHTIFHFHHKCGARCTHPN